MILGTLELCTLWLKVTGFLKRAQDEPALDPATRAAHESGPLLPFLEGTPHPTTLDKPKCGGDIPYILDKSP